MIKELAELTGNANLVKIHLGDQTDAKVLLGTYVCTDIPGEFKWIPGVLTQVMADLIDHSHVSQGRVQRNVDCSRGH